MKKIGFILDLDGTLLNSTDIGRNVQQKIVDKFHITVSPERKRELEALAENMLQQEYSTRLAIKIIWTLLREVGLSVRQRINAMLFAGKLYLKEIKNLKLYDGVDELFQFLDTNSYDYVIVTNSSNKDLSRTLKKLPEFYNRTKDRIITKDDVIHMKPHLESFEKAAKIMGLSSDKIVVVGDTKFDILFGKAAKAITIGVLTGIYSKEFLLKYEPDFVFDSVADIPKNIDKILDKLNESV